MRRRQSQKPSFRVTWWMILLVAWLLGFALQCYDEYRWGRARANYQRAQREANR